MLLVFLLLEFQSELFVVALALVVPVGFPPVVDLPEELLVVVLVLLFASDLGEYHQPYINSLSKTSRKIFLFSSLVFLLLLAAPPPPPRWDHKAKKEGTRQIAIERVQPFKERSRLTRAPLDKP